MLSIGLSHTASPGLDIHYGHFREGHPWLKIIQPPLQGRWKKSSFPVGGLEIAQFCSTLLPSQPFVTLVNININLYSLKAYCLTGRKARHTLSGRESQTEMKTRRHVIHKEWNSHIDNIAGAAPGCRSSAGECTAHTLLSCF